MNTKRTKVCAKIRAVQNPHTEIILDLANNFDCMVDGEMRILHTPKLVIELIHIPSNIKLLQIKNFQT